MQLNDTVLTQLPFTRFGHSLIGRDFPEYRQRSPAGRAVKRRKIEEIFFKHDIMKNVGSKNWWL